MKSKRSVPFIVRTLVFVLMLLLSVCDAPRRQQMSLRLNRQVRYTRHATGNQLAFELLDDEMCNDASTYPPQEVIQKLEAGMPLDEAGQRMRDELWKEVKR